MRASAEFVARLRGQLNCAVRGEDRLLWAAPAAGIAGVLLLVAGAVRRGRRREGSA